MWRLWSGQDGHEPGWQRICRKRAVCKANKILPPVARCEARTARSVYSSKSLHSWILFILRIRGDTECNIDRKARPFMTEPDPANSEHKTHQTGHKTSFGEASIFYGWPNINTAGIWLPTCAVDSV